MSEPKHLLTSIQLLAVGLHDTGQHADYFILHEQKKTFIDWRGSKSEIYIEDFKPSRTF